MFQRHVCIAEWYFRSSLDRYVWIHGMLFAYLHPSFEATLQHIDKFATGARLFIRTLIIAGQTCLLSKVALHRSYMSCCELLQTETEA